MRSKWCVAFVLAAALAAPAASLARPAQQDYLTQTEADKIRNAYTPNARIKLFLDFAADRLRRFQHELEFKNAGPRRADFLNSLLNAFTACVDDASDRIDDAISNGENVRDGVKDFQKRVPEFLAELQKIQTKGADVKPVQFALSDSIDDLKDDLKDVAKAKKRLEMNLSKPKRHGEDRR